MTVCPTSFKLFNWIAKYECLVEVYQLSQVARGKKCPWWCDKRHVNKLCLGRPPTDMWLVGDLHHSSTTGAQVWTFMWYYSPSLQAVLCGFPRNQEVLKTFLGFFLLTLFWANSMQQHFASLLSIKRFFANF